jgi:hypothetical protein
VTKKIRDVTPHQRVGSWFSKDPDPRELILRCFEASLTKPRVSRSSGGSGACLGSPQRPTGAKLLRRQLRDMWEVNKSHLRSPRKRLSEGPSCVDQCRAASGGTAGPCTTPRVKDLPHFAAGQIRSQQGRFAAECALAQSDQIEKPLSHKYGSRPASVTTQALSE